MREFRPPQVRSRARTIIGLVLLAIAVLPVALVGSLLIGRQQISYRLAEGQLTVFTGGLYDRQRVMAVRQIRSARTVELSRGRRSLGTALPGYCVGRFEYPELGPVWQATDCGRRGVILSRRDNTRPWLISPPDREDFLARLSSGEPAFVELPAARKGAYAWLMLVLLVGALTAIGLLEAVVFLGPSRLVYRLGDGLVEVRTLLARRRWQAKGLRARRHWPRVTFRVAGSAMPGYYTGLFRADGKSTRIYATRLEEGVLLEGKQRIYLSPEDVDGFLEELEAQGTAVEGDPPVEDLR